jgi:hypothetical protein
VSARDVNAQPRAGDASKRGPLATVTESYAFTARTDAATDPASLKVLPGCKTVAAQPKAKPPITAFDCKWQLVAQVYRPDKLTSPPYPLLIFLHGNHPTCGKDVPGGPRIDDNSEFTGDGKCPAGYRKFTTGGIETGVPSDRGYEYLGTRLASHGYVVVSINANRGINGRDGQVMTDPSLIRARGQLVLKHLQLLSEWNTKGGNPRSIGVDLKGKLDFTNVGLMGHSRGGEGVRMAYLLYGKQSSPWPNKITNATTFKGIFEVAPTDILAGATPAGISWNVLLPMCDGDVADLQGVRPFDRVLESFRESPATPKSSYTVWGANHNFYNTEWQVSDATVAGTAICNGPAHKALFPASPGSAAQRLTALSSIVAFFRSTVGGAVDPKLGQNFDPYFGLPATVFDEGNNQQAFPTRVDRGFTPSPNSATVTTVLDDFNTSPLTTAKCGKLNDAGGVTTRLGRVPNHDRIQRACLISWTKAAAKGADVFFQANWTGATENGEDLAAFKTLEFRVSRQSSALNPADPTDFSIQLASADAKFTKPLLLSTYTKRKSNVESELTGPVGTTKGGPHPILQTVRIPLAEFEDLDAVKGNMRGVRFTFDKTAKGAIHLANIRMSKAAVGVEAKAAQAARGAVVVEAPEALTADQLGRQLEEPEELPSVERPAAPELVHECRVESIRAKASIAALRGRPGVEIRISSADKFPVRNQQTILQIGRRQFSSFRAEDPYGSVAAFTLRKQQFDRLEDGDKIIVQYGREPSNEWWSCGVLDRSIVAARRTPRP